MRDLTKNSIGNHIWALAAPAAISMVTQVAYQLVDLYFITQIGVDATAGVSAAGNAVVLFAALAQILSVGTAPLVAHAVGHNDRESANTTFNQSLMLCTALGVLAMACLYLGIRPYLRSVSADAMVVNAGTAFMFWMLPGLALSVPMAGTGAAWRGTGVVKPYVLVSALTVAVNALLAPILIAGWGTGLSLGAQGAGVATSISILIGAVTLAAYFRRSERYLRICLRSMRPQLAQWLRIVRVGLPIGGEFALMFLSTAIVYYAIRDFGATAQAGFAIGSRVLQMVVLPSMAIGFAAGPIAAQNFGARNGQRVRETFRQAALFATLTMVGITLLVQWRANMLVNLFDASTPALNGAALFLQLMSWTFVAQGLVYICSNLFQGLGDTVPALLSSAARFLVFAAAAVWLRRQRGFSVEHMWYLMAASVVLQAAISLYLLRIRFKTLLPPLAQ